MAAPAAFAALLTESGRRGRFVPPAFAALALAGLWGSGELRLRHAVAPDAGAPVVRVVQPDVKEQAKFTEDNLRSIFFRYVSLTAAPARQAPDIVVWSEGAIPLSADELLSPGGPVSR